MRKTFTACMAAILFGVAAFLASTPAAFAAEVTLYKSPQCGCCENYADYLRENGFSVTVKPTWEVEEMSREAGIPSERPDIRGITLPGMPMGSPGMNGKKRGEFTVYEIGKTGDERLEVYASE